MSRSLITQVARLLSHKEHWCQGALARNAKGYPCEPSKGEQWDAFGAVYKLSHTPLKASDFPKSVGSSVAAMNLAALSLHRMSMEQVNDRLGHEAVIGVLRRAWAISKSAEDEDDQ